MSTRKERLENRTQKILKALDDLAALADQEIEPAHITKIERAINHKLNVTMQSLKRQLGSFKL